MPMPAPPRYRSDASTLRRVRPGDLPCAVGILLDGEPLPVGIAHGAGWIGSVEEGPPEQAWRLVVRGEVLERRWALRGGCSWSWPRGREGRGGNGASAKHV
jgi:hypothetical protein